MLKNILELLNIYNRPGGRYTYYPMIAQWKNNLNIFQWWDSLEKHYDPNLGIDLYLHIPFCESLCTFCGCNIRVTKNHDEVKNYITALKTEWQLYQKVFGTSPKINSLYLGGGSPNYLTPSELTEILEFFQFDQDSFLSIELDSRKTSVEFLSVLKEFNFKWLSFGIQDTNSEVLRNVNRDSPLDELKKIITLTRQMKFAHINLDFIYGLTFQTPDSLKKTFEDFFLLKPDSLALYPFARVPWQNNSQQVSGVFKDNTPEEIHQLYITADGEVLKTGEYHFLGMGHYAHQDSLLYTAKQNQSLRRNIMGFTPSKKSSLLIGLGVSSISSSPDGMIQNEKILEKYQFELIKDRAPLFKSHLKTNDEQELSAIFEKIICQGSFKKTIGNESFEIYKNEGFFIVKDDQVTVTELGRYFLKNICQLLE